ncbi:U2-associated protein SR140, partial [Nannochloropsis gaditana CCMP526]
AFLTGRQAERARDIARGRAPSSRLSRKDYETFVALLRALDGGRAKIKEGMGFALDHADASEEVVGLLKESLCAEKGWSEDLAGEQPVSLSRRVARLYLVSDILHNSSAGVRNASTYRTSLQLALPYVFSAFHNSLAVLGRLTAQHVEEKLLKVLKVWGEWSIYPPLFIAGLEATLTVDLEKEGEEKEGEEEGKEEDLEKGRDALVRQARQAGLTTEGPLVLLLRKMKRLDEFVKKKAAGENRLEGGRWTGGDTRGGRGARGG